MTGYGRTQRTMPWVIVGVFLAGALTVGVGIASGGLAVAVTGAAVVIAASIAAIALPHAGLSAPISLGAQFPERTPPDDRRRRPPYRTMTEVQARELPEGPDSGRAHPQHVNLAPTEHLRMVDGEEVIEVPDDV